MIQNHSIADKFIHLADQALRTVSGSHSSSRPYPGDALQDAPKLEARDKEQAVRLMRINHAGEVAAQGLYHGQALSARDAQTREHMMHNAQEEADHLYWCRKRLQELGGRHSVFTPFWYLGSVGIGAFAGLWGDRVSHAFVRETEEQVVEHLQAHLDKLCADDKITRSVLEQMQADEAQHADSSKRNSTYHLPRLVKNMMRYSARIMTRTTKWL